MSVRIELAQAAAVLGLLAGLLGTIVLSNCDSPAGLLLVAAAALHGIAYLSLARTKRRSLDAALSALGEGMLVYDRNDRLLAWNEAGCTLSGMDVGFPRQGIPHRDVVLHLHRRGEFGVDRTEPDILAELDRRPLPYDGTRKRSNGRYVRIRRTRTPDGGTVVVLTDVTDITLAEEWLNATNEELEQRVKDRVAELDRSVNAMQEEIARRKEAEAWLLELNARNDLLAAVIEADASGVIIADAASPEFSLIYCNGAFTRLTGYDREEAIGRHPRLLDGPETSPEARARVRDAVAKGEADELEMLHYRKDGTPFWDHISIFPVRDKEGRVTHYVGSMHDVTERRQAQEEAVRMQARMTEVSKFEALGTLAGGVAHEINTPIQYVGDNLRFLQSSFADLLGAIDACAGDAGSRAVVERLQTEADLDFLRQEVPTAVSQALDGVSRVGQIVQAIKEFSHPSAKQAAPFDLNHAIETAVTVSRNQWKYFAEVSLDLDSALPAVTGNQGEINQVLLNMIVNAAHAIEEAGRKELGRIVIGTRARDGEIELSIRDDGVGIPKDKQQKIFEMFYTTKPPGKGTGQGLAICHTIVVQRHGGAVSVESEPGAGTCFRITLPVEGIQQARAA